jgi:ectoine hydroxylase-related dioxygenase (phytanoyl-CoA dioxygenase family)
MKLTEQQLSFFHTFGYLAFPGLFADDVDAITREFEAVWERHGGGHNGRPHDGERRSCIFPFLDQSDSLSALLDDPRVLGIATALLGDDFNYMGSDGNYYAGDTGWHSDGFQAEYRVKIAFYLDPLARDTGCLRVIPGSHLPGDRYADSLQQQAGRSRDRWNVDGRDVPAVALETRPGDLVCFNQNTKHASFGGSPRRRMFTINFARRFPEERLQELRDYCTHHARFWTEHLYGMAMVLTAGPERMRHLEQVLANDGHMAELARQARERMAEPSRG